MSTLVVRDSADPQEHKTIRARLAVLLGDRRGTILLLAISAMISGFAEVGILFLLSQIASSAAKGAVPANQSIAFVHFHASVRTLFILAFALTIGRVALQAPLSILPARIASTVQARLRREVFGAYNTASWAVQAGEREGDVQEVMTSQVLQATGGALQATQLVIAFFSFLVLMAGAVSLSAIAALVILVAALCLFGLLRPLNSMGARRATELSRAQLNYAAGINEASRLAEETQVFGVAEAQFSRIDKLIAIAEGLFYRTQLIIRLSPSLYQSAIYLILVAGLAALYSEGASHFASLGAVILIIVRAGTFGQQVQGAYQGLRQSLPFIERLQDTASRYAASTPPDGSERLAKVDTIAFDHVSFGYRAEQPVLRDLSFEVRAGEAIGVVGPSGAGKSTLIQILLQLRPPGEGRYLVNGVPVADFVRADWKRLVAYVPQQPRLVHASVAENIRYFRDLDDEAVQRAARLARIEQDILAWRDGYETIVGPRADAVSGGQQQRICLARALAARPEVLVLDEPTSALDPHSETLIQESLYGLRHELTLFIIAHRISTLDVCDRVMVIQDGRLAAFDTTALLQTNNDYYRSASLLAAGGGSGGTLV
ncbi:MAG TPA: ABC transporter ATP-binding protein [Solirubrobacteraceae bacterium]